MVMLSFLIWMGIRGSRSESRMYSTQPRDIFMVIKIMLTVNFKVTVMVMVMFKTKVEVTLVGMSVVTWS
jgi:hypothetical protein